MPLKVLSVFVQPDNWTGDEQQRPMKKLNVTLEHFLGSELVRGNAAMRSTENNCKRCLSDLSRNMNLMRVRKGKSSTTSECQPSPIARYTPIMYR